jgi:antitoxin PrlF
MTTATITSKGQITIPASVRAAMSLEAGTKVEFVEVAPKRFEIIPINRSVMELKGMFAHKALKRPVTIEEMNEAVKQAAAESYLRSVRE